MLYWLIYCMCIWQTQHSTSFWLWRPGTQILEERRVQLSNLRRRHLGIIVWCGSKGVEYQLPWHNSRPDQERDWRSHWGREHCVPVLWDVEVVVSVAHGGHGLVQYQLPSLRSTEVVVCCATRARLSVRALGCRSVVLQIAWLFIRLSSLYLEVNVSCKLIKCSLRCSWKAVASGGDLCNQDILDRETRCVIQHILR